MLEASRKHPGRVAQLVPSPHGLRGDDIPLAARIVHVADAFDAMTSARAYRPALPLSFAVTELQQGAGTDFDPGAVEALCAALATSFVV